MSFCIKCGSKNEPGTKFCIKCGTPLVVGSIAATAVHSQVAAPVVAPNPWFAKNKNYVFAGVGILIVIYAVNHFFFRPDPAKEARSLAAAECGCEQERIRSATETIKSYLRDFSTYQFASVYEARQKIDSMQQKTQEEYRDCSAKSSERRSDLMKKYDMNETGGTAFREAYFLEQRNCQPANEELNNLGAELAMRFTNFSAFTPPITPAPTVPQDPEPQALTEAVPVPQAETAPATVDPAVGPTDEALKQLVSQLYQAENSLSNPDGISGILQFYAFPLDRYYDAKRIGTNALSKIYADSYFKSLSHHKVSDFENKMTVSRQPDGTIKVIAGCTFEFSTSQSPAEIRSRKVYNVYVFNPAGKITSVYQLM